MAQKPTDEELEQLIEEEIHRLHAQAPEVNLDDPRMADQFYVHARHNVLTRLANQTPDTPNL